MNVVTCPDCEGTGKGYAFNYDSRAVYRFTGAALLPGLLPTCRTCAGSGCVAECTDCAGTGRTVSEGSGAYLGEGRYAREDGYAMDCPECDGRGHKGEVDVPEAEAAGFYQCVGCGLRTPVPYFVAGDESEVWCIECVRTPRHHAAMDEMLK